MLSVLLYYVHVKRKYFEVEKCCFVQVNVLTASFYPRLHFLSLNLCPENKSAHLTTCTLYIVMSRVQDTLNFYYSLLCSKEDFMVKKSAYPNYVLGLHQNVG